ncbi:MAG: sigma-70 family RNA polymerase sigma factor [Planctomycetes bacterium]|nr:sigma-70 family RNA polymerase sigma factor [Planctomycetota bacterium]
MPPLLGQTRATLLQRLSASDNAAWAEFVLLYREAIIRFCLSRSLQLSDAEDIAQSVLTNLARTFPNFTYTPSRGRFRDYLFHCIRAEMSKLPNRSRPYQSDSTLYHKEDDSDHSWEKEWVQHHFRLAMAAIQDTFEPKSVEIFERSLEGVSTQLLATEFSTSEDAVHKIRQRIRLRLKELITEQVAAEERGATADHTTP